MTYHWITAKFPGRCPWCSGPIKQGDRVLHEVEMRRVCCEPCGRKRLTYAHRLAAAAAVPPAPNQKRQAYRLKR